MSARISKFLSLVLRHEPQRIGIVLDETGWTDVAALLDAAAAHGVVITRDELAHVVATNAKQRFALSPDGARIRAHQGHSGEVDLQLEPVARHHAIERLVLGAWGAGVFGNDPAMVADAWKRHLADEFAGAFDEVVFAVIGSPESSANHRAFVAAFGGT